MTRSINEGDNGEGHEQPEPSFDRARDHPSEKQVWCADSEVRGPRQSLGPRNDRIGVHLLLKLIGKLRKPVTFLPGFCAFDWIAALRSSAKALIRIVP